MNTGGCAQCGGKLSIPKAKKTVRTKPKLWNCIVETIKKTNHYGVKDVWNARRSQLAVRIYKQMGGGYVGDKEKGNTLDIWTKQQWNYIDGDKQGRYLPKSVRDKLTKTQKKKENKLKKGKRGEKVPYTPEVKKLMRQKHIY